MKYLTVSTVPCSQAYRKSTLLSLSQKFFHSSSYSTCKSPLLHATSTLSLILFSILVRILSEKKQYSNRTQLNSVTEKHLFEGVVCRHTQVTKCWVYLNWSSGNHKLTTYNYYTLSYTTLFYSQIALSLHCNTLFTNTGN